jgi:hypothetical protein
MQIRFAGYSGDCRVSGNLDLTADRLTEMLNAQEDVVLEDAILESLDDGRRLAIARVTLHREELYAVEATGPRGHPSRRLHTTHQRLQIQMGPYTILGQLHTRPGAAALGSLLRRGPIVPLSEATIGYLSGGQLQMHDTDTLLVNRELAEWVAAAAADARAFPGIPTIEIGS